MLPLQVWGVEATTRNADSITGHYRPTKETQPAIAYLSFSLSHVGPRGIAASSRLSRVRSGMWVRAIVTHGRISHGRSLRSIWEWSIFTTSKRIAHDTFLRTFTRVPWLVPCGNCPVAKWSSIEDVVGRRSVDTACATFEAIWSFDSVHLCNPKVKRSGISSRGTFNWD